MNTKEYMPWFEQQRLIKERMRQPIERDGILWISTVVAAEQLNLKPNLLRVLGAKYPGASEIVVTGQGVRFIRLPRGRGDLRPPLYWDLESLKRIYG